MERDSYTILKDFVRIGNILGVDCIKWNRQLGRYVVDRSHKTHIRIFLQHFIIIILCLGASKDITNLYNYLDLAVDAVPYFAYTTYSYLHQESIINVFDTFQSIDNLLKNCQVELVKRPAMKIFKLMLMLWWAVALGALPFACVSVYFHVPKYLLLKYIPATGGIYVYILVLAYVLLIKDRCSMVNRYLKHHSSDSYWTCPTCYPVNKTSLGYASNDLCEPHRIRWVISTHDKILRTWNQMNRHITAHVNIVCAAAYIEVLIKVSHWAGQLLGSIPTDSILPLLINSSITLGVTILGFVAIQIILSTEKEISNTVKIIHRQYLKFKNIKLIKRELVAFSVHFAKHKPSFKLFYILETRNSILIMAAFSYIGINTILLQYHIVLG